MTGLESTIVVIPALNEEASIGLVLGDLPPVRQVIVVDNGSEDCTAERARAAGAHVVTEAKRGYGRACLRGLQEIRASVSAGTEPPLVVVFCDADYSDHVHQLPDLIQPILENRADLVIGSRILGERETGAMPLQSLWGNRLACLLMNWTTGYRYTDLGPFRAVRYTSLIDLGMVDQNYGWTVEMQIKAAQQGWRIDEIPTPYRKRLGASKISGTVAGTLKAGSTILYLIFKYAVVGKTPSNKQAKVTKCVSP